MSSFALPRVPGTALYGIAALVALFELGVGWVSIHPHVSADYRAYYLDKTTTCLNEPVLGSYAYGSEVRTVSGFETTIKPIRVCGWEGPAGNGLHAVGEQARLRFGLVPGVHDVPLMLEMSAVDFAKPTGQPVEVVANGVTLGTATVHSGQPQRFIFTVPDSALGADHLLDVELRFPEAILVDPQDSNTRKRSIKLTAVRVGEASHLSAA